MGMLVLKDLSVEAIIVLGGCQCGEWIQVTLSKRYSGGESYKLKYDAIIFSLWGPFGLWLHGECRRDTGFTVVS